MPKLDLDSIPWTNRTGYPAPYSAEMGKRHYKRLGAAAGTATLGASLCRIEPGGVSSQRHWHDAVDEFVVMLEGEAVLVEDDGEAILRPGDCAAFPMGAANGHRLENRTDADCLFVALSGPEAGDCHYPDVDLHWDAAGDRYTSKDGTPY